MSLRNIVSFNNLQINYVLPYFSQNKYISSRVSTAVKGNPHIRNNITYDYKVRQDDLIDSAIKEFNIKSNKEWANLRKKVLESGTIINNINFDAKVMGHCLTHKNMNAAQSYLGYIKSNNAIPNMATFGKLLKLYYMCNENCEQINKNDEDKIIEIYKNLKSQSSLLDPTTAENAIHALSLTKNWNECLELLETIKISAKPSASTFSVIIRALFKNRQFEKARRMVTYMTLNDRLPYPMVYHAWLNAIPRNYKNVVGEVTKLISYFEDNDIRPTKCVTDKIYQVLLKHSYTGEYTKLVKNGSCTGCKKQMNEIKISQEDFDKLRSAFLNNVIVGKNIFNKTTPEELENFQRYLDKIGHYDIVVDGLNVAYCAGTKRPVNIYAKMITSVVKHFAANNKKILVLGRKHMAQWPNLEYVKANSNLFLAQNISQDDPFLLYAAMKKGLGTYFLSRDLMRGHSYLLLDENFKRLFRRWQQSHQYSLIYVENNGNVHVKYPSKGLPTAQSHSNGWHIPYITKHMSNPPLTLEHPEDWLCLRKKKPYP